MPRIQRQRFDLSPKQVVDYQIQAYHLQRIAIPQNCRAQAFVRRTELVKGLSLRGYIATTFAELLTTFGEPRNFHEVPANWDIRFQDGTDASIYINKVRGIPEYLYLWHVGGRTRTALQRAAEALHTDYYLPRNAYLSGEDLVDRSDEIPF